MCEIKHIDFYAGDWISGTTALSLEERGLFITACAMIYGNGGPVERDRLHRACGVHGRTFNAILGRLLALGKLYEEAGKIGQKRAENELKKARKRLEKWAKNLDIPIKPNGYADRAAGNARASLTTNHHPKADALGEVARARAIPPDPPDRKISPGQAKEGFAADWLPDEEGELFALDRGYSQAWVIEEAERCRDHYRARGTVFVDLAAVWRGWVRTAREFEQRSQGGTNGRHQLSARDTLHLAGQLAAQDLDRQLGIVSDSYPADVALLDRYGPH